MADPKNSGTADPAAKKVRKPRTAKPISYGAKVAKLKADHFVMLATLLRSARASLTDSADFDSKALPGIANGLKPSNPAFDPAAFISAVTA